MFRITAAPRTTTSRQSSGQGTVQPTRSSTSSGAAAVAGDDAGDGGAAALPRRPLGRADGLNEPREVVHVPCAWLLSERARL